MIVIDVANRHLQLEISDAELERRLAEWSPPEPRYASGVFAKYANSVSSASCGAVTNRVQGSASGNARGAGAHRAAAAVMAFGGPITCE
jgi:dihydroxy-acid dehydratase